MSPSLGRHPLILTSSAIGASLPHIRLLAALFILGACASGYAAVTLAWPGSALDVAWSVNPEGHAGLRSLGPVAIVGMAVLSATMVVTALGLVALRRWAWWIAVVGLAANATGDLATTIATGEPRTLIGVPVAGLIVWWLTRLEVRSRFG
jgi:hypothetical protein